MRRRERAAPYEEERDGDGAGDPRDPRRTRREASQGGMQVSRHHRFLAAARRVCSSILCCRCVTDCWGLSSSDHRSASATQEEPETTREETSDELKKKTDEEPKEEEMGEVPKEEQTDEEPEEEETDKEPKEEEKTDKEPKEEETDEKPKEEEEETDEVPKEGETEEEPKEKQTDELPKEEETDEQPKEKDEQPKEEETDKVPKTDEEPKTEEKDEESKKEKDEEPILQPERTAFFRCLEDHHVKMFLARDSCYKISDKYLLAMVLRYFRRAGLCTEEYSIFFYPALFLANQMEEDEAFRREIFPWALGPFWTMSMDWFLQLRNNLLEQMGFQAWVDRATCDLIMAQDPEHWAWTRERKEHHSWAIRWCRRDREEYILKGPWRIPPPCSLCNIDVHPCAGEENIQCRTDATAEPGAAESPTCPMCHCQEGECTFLETML